MYHKINKMSISYIIISIIMLVIGIMQVDNIIGNDNDDKREWGMPIESQSISIKTNKTIYAPEEPINLNVAYKNVGHDDVKYGIRAPLAIYEINVYLPSGIYFIEGDALKEKKESPLTLYGRKLQDNSNLIVSQSNKIIKPGEQRTDELELSRIYDFSLDGKYTIIVKKKIRKHDNEKEITTVTSNKLEITIDNQIERK
jgi:hypothetical protein